MSLHDHAYQPELRVAIDLDPSGVEAVDRVGPELGITAAGEVTLDGAVVVVAEWVGNVIAALADPPRALVMCGNGSHHVVGPGFDETVGGYFAAGDQAAIQENLTLGRRLICVSGACIDLVTGRDFSTFAGEHVWDNERRGRVLVAAGLDTGPLRWRVVARRQPMTPAP